MKRVVLFLAVLALSATSASAAPIIRGFGFSAGYISPEDADGTFGFGAFADIALAIPSFSISPYADYWKTSEDFPDGGEASARDIVVGAHGLYSIALPNPVISPFLGAGAGLHFTRAEIDFGSSGLFGDGSTDVSESKLGFDVGGGMGAGLGSVQLRGEGWYTFVEDFNYWTLKLGLMFPIGG